MFTGRPLLLIRRDCRAEVPEMGMQPQRRTSQEANSFLKVSLSGTWSRRWMCGQRSSSISAASAA